MSGFPFVLIVGPTASGKSDLSLRLAERFQGVILNCDSLQFYQRMDIGTAKPTPEERDRVPHFLFDVVPPGEVLTAGDYRRAAMQVLERELPQRMVFGVGGSGFYIQALEKGMFDVPKPRPEIDRQVRARLEEKGLSALYRELVERDPKYAEDINPNDSYRIVRALVLMEDSGKTVTEVRTQFKQQEFPFPLLKLGLAPAREELLPRVEKRVLSMLQRGFMEEVQGLLRDGWENWPPLQSVGYKECIQFLRGEIDDKRLMPLIVEKTMQLSKKQKTWFKRDPEIHWLPGDDAFERAEILVAAYLDRLGRTS
ncbi:MAG: tRNA (adenosine(37)-N6)-dimethylallyltransferase MiaA [Bdellovibrionales bacterium]|nr:tRNA (adenosine(37)-N6)-dimethylallyltransferase MiaA [Bdellovibrionales bacterium]